MQEFNLQDFIQGINPDKNDIIEHYLGFGIDRLSEAPLDEIKKALSESIVQKCMIFTELIDQSTTIHFDDSKVIVGISTYHDQKNYQIVLILNQQFRGLIKIKTVAIRSRTNYVCETHFCNEASFKFLNQFFKEFEPIRPAIAA